MTPSFFKQTAGFVVFFLASMGAWAQSIELTQASVPIRDGMIYLSATADIRLPNAVRDALEKGVGLIFVTTIQVRKEQYPLLPAKRMSELKIKRRLSYHALTKRFTVDDLTFKKRESFSSLLRALTYLGKYRDVSVISESLVKEETDVSIRIRVALTREELPVPLRLKSYWPGSWYLFSDWYEWSLP